MPFASLLGSPLPTRRTNESSGTWKYLVRNVHWTADAWQIVKCLIVGFFTPLNCLILLVLENSICRIFLLFCFVVYFIKEIYAFFPQCMML